MRQVLQSYRDGRISLGEVPAPVLRRGQVLVRGHASLVSAGTEKYMITLAQKSLLGKALARPDWTRQVIDKARAEGVLEAYRQAMARLDVPVPLGYAMAGEVVETALDVRGFAPGKRVACAGSEHASHAEFVAVPEGLCVPLPDDLGFEEGCFAALGAIALHAFRCAAADLGATVAVVGLGLLGQLVAGIAVAAGCRVLGMDLSKERCRLAAARGVEATAGGTDEFIALCADRSAGLGVDAAIIAAHASDNGPIELAANVCRERGRVVAAGLVGLDLPRKVFFEKELDVVVSRAWGPGAFDADVEERNLKYPLSYVRWTAGENMREFLRLVASRRVSLEGIITHRFAIDEAERAYDVVLGKTNERSMGVILTYGDARVSRRVDTRPTSTLRRRPHSKGGVGTSVIGAGMFARGTMMPAIKKVPGVELRGVASSGGTSAAHLARAFGFAYSASDVDEVFHDPGTDLVCVLTRHDSHGRLAAEVLGAGKHVFVEKPLAVDEEQLALVLSARRAAGGLLMVGFNRRHSPAAQWLRRQFAEIGDPVAVHCTINAGRVDGGHWTQDAKEGGGRIVGEVCHFVDLLHFLTGSVSVRVHTEVLRPQAGRPPDTMVATLLMANGALGSIAYLAGGDKRFPRERIEVFGGGAVGLIDNFRAASFIRGGKRRSVRSRFGVDRGHRAELTQLVDAIRRGGPPPVPFEDYVRTTRATFALQESATRGIPVAVSTELQQGSDWVGEL